MGVYRIHLARLTDHTRTIRKGQIGNEAKLLRNMAMLARNSQHAGA